MVARLVAVLTLAVTIGIGSAPATASPAVVTVYGPTHGALHSKVFVSGHTAEPGQRVFLHYRDLERQQYRSSAPVISQANTAYTIELPLPLDADYAYYATSNGAATKVHTVRVNRASCTSSGPAFSTIPVTGSDLGLGPAFAGFTTTRGGVWAGAAIKGSRFALIRWSHAHGLRVLARFDYSRPGGVSYGPYLPGSVNAVGITPYGSVVAAVENTITGHSEGFVWTPDGTRHRLSSAPSWFDVSPTAVADDGTIYGVGTAHGGSNGVSYLVSWANALAPYRVLTHLANGLQQPAVDARGDLAYTLPSGGAHVRLATGEVRTLATQSDIFVNNVVSGGDHSLYGNDDFFGVVRWNFADAPPSGPITAQNFAAVSGIDGVGHDGDVVIDNGSDNGRAFQPFHVMTAHGHYGDVPARDQRESLLAVDYRGVVAYTSNTDHLPHFLTCK